MAEFDVIIRGGTIVDGLLTPRYRSDLAIKDGRIVQIGGLRSGTAGKVLDATGLIVAPGHVDLHTHYDAQIQWDPYLTLSGWHGVTTVAIGNCGFRFRPLPPRGPGPGYAGPHPHRGHTLRRHEAGHDLGLGDFS